MRLAALLAIALTATAVADDTPNFQTTRLTDAFYGEGASIGDFNKDGHPDIISGPFIYLGPDFHFRSELYPPVSHDPHHYSKSFLQYTHDINGDGWTDIVEVGFPGEATYWYENPAGKRNTLTGDTRGHWDRHLILKVTDNESPVWGDITGDGRPELIAQTAGQFGYVTPTGDDPVAPWTFHPISPKGNRGRFTHGIGFGDVNGDGRMDLLEKTGWWEQPESLDGDPAWTHHPVNFARNAAQMYAFDVDGDGDNDVITSLQAHGWGLAWYEQQGDDGKITFQKHVIMGDPTFDNPQDVCFSQPHAIHIADMNGDDLPDIVTGKRFWAHGPKGDVNAQGPPVLYYFQLVRQDGSAHFKPVKMHGLSGVGTQVTAGDINKDGKPDVVVGNKLGTFVTIQK